VETGRPANPLALAVLGLLLERPMHPHAMAATLRERTKDQSVKLTTGSLYDVVRALERDGWITATETVRVGNRPPRTVYAHTSDGRDRFVAWLDELIRVPVQEYPRFATAVGYLGALGPGRARDALAERARHLSRRLDEVRTVRHEVVDSGVLPRLFMIEAEYAERMLAAELAWLRDIVDDLDRGALPWPAEVTMDIEAHDGH
jgi:DNA-binding PadR family transcriptional regulator